MQQKTTAESEHNLKAFCRPVTLTDSSTPTFIHLFTLCFQLWFVPMAHALGPSHRFITSFSRSPADCKDGLFLFQNASDVLKEKTGIEEPYRGVLQVNFFSFRSLVSPQ